MLTAPEQLRQLAARAAQAEADQALPGVASRCGPRPTATGQLASAAKLCPPRAARQRRGQAHSKRELRTRLTRTRALATHAPRRRPDLRHTAACLLVAPGPAQERGRLRPTRRSRTDPSLLRTNPPPPTRPRRRPQAQPRPPPNHRKADGRTTTPRSPTSSGARPKARPTARAIRCLKRFLARSLYRKAGGNAARNLTRIEASPVTSKRGRLRCRRRACEPGRVCGVATGTTKPARWRASVGSEGWISVAIIAFTVPPAASRRCRFGQNLASGRCAESVSDHPAAQGGRRLDLVAGVDEDLEQPDRRLVPDHGLPRRRLGRIAL